MKRLSVVLAVVALWLGLGVTPASATQTIRSGYFNLSNGCQTYWQQLEETQGPQAEAWSYSSNCIEDVVLHYGIPGGGSGTTTSPWVASWAERYCNLCTLIWSDHNFRAWTGYGWAATAYGYRKYW